MYLMIYDHALHFICILTMFYAFRYVFNYVEMCAGRFGLGFTHDLFIFACHMFMHISCIRILSFLSSLFCWWCVFSLSPSLSLEIFWLGFVYLMIYHHALHFICILTMFHAFRGAFNYVEMYAGRFGLGFTHDVFIFVCHMFMHISCIYSLFSFFFVLLVMCFLSFSLSLSWIDCAWHLSTNLLQLGTLLIPSLFLLILHPPSSRSIPWWEGWAGLAWELSETWRSSKAPCHSIRLFQHSFIRCHLDSGIGISLWDTLNVPYRVYTGVLLQYTRYRYIYTSVCHDI